jgi:magnesium-protoporphyrin O-methyltransferase
MFDARIAARELRRYRRKGARPTTRALRDGIRMHVPDAATLLDIGSGIGALTFEILDAGVRQATAVDASGAFVEAARAEAARRHVEHRVEWRHADFVAAADSIPAADVVTLDRVVCCYPVVDALLSEAAAHAQKCLALSYPLERWYVQGAVSLQNALRRLSGNVFEVFVHPVSRMEEIVRRHGFRLACRRGRLVWRTDVYVREAGAGTR